jgi:hypothetical protein
MSIIGQEIEQLENEKEEILNMLEHVFLGYVYYSGTKLRDDCEILLRKYGKLLNTR